MHDVSLCFLFNCYIVRGSSTYYVHIVTNLVFRGQPQPWAWLAISVVLSQRARRHFPSGLISYTAHFLGEEDRSPTVRSQEVKLIFYFFILFFYYTIIIIIMSCSMSMNNNVFNRAKV